MNNNMRNIKKSLTILSFSVLIAVSFSIFYGSATTQPTMVISVSTHAEECLQTNRNNNDSNCEKTIVNTNLIYRLEKNQNKVKSNTSDIETYTASAMTNNPHLPVITELIQNEIESDDDNLRGYSYALEAGQSITYGYPVSIDSQLSSNVEEKSYDGYFLQPGQTRTVSSQLAASQDLANED